MGLFKFESLHVFTCWVTEAASLVVPRTGKSSAEGSAAKAATLAPWVTWPNGSKPKEIPEEPISRWDKAQGDTVALRTTLGCWNSRCYVKAVPSATGNFLTQRPVHSQWWPGLKRENKGLALFSWFRAIQKGSCSGTPYRICWDLRCLHPAQCCLTQLLRDVRGQPLPQLSISESALRQIINTPQRHLLLWWPYGWESHFVLHDFIKTP